MTRRFMAILLSALLVLTALAACSSPSDSAGSQASPNNPNDPNEPNNPNNPDNPPGQTDGTPNEWGWVVPEKTLEISIYGGQGDPVEFAEDEYGGKAHVDAWLLANLNVKINWEIYSTDRTEQLNFFLAAGDYPEVLTAVPDIMANEFASQGRAVDLAPYLDTHLSNLSRRMGSFIGMLKTDDGKLYKLPNAYGEQVNVAGWDFGIRYDLWSELGLPVYNTPEGFYEALKAVVEANPTNAAGQKTYGVSAMDGASALGAGIDMLKGMMAAYGFSTDLYKHNSDNTFSYWLNTPEGKDVAVLMNKMWRDGLIDPDYATRTYDDYIAMQTNEVLLGNLGQWWWAFVGGHESWASSDPNLPVEKRFMNVSVAGPGVPVEKTRLLTSNFLGNDRCLVTDKCNQVEAVLAYLNWQNSELGNFITGWGPPSETNVWNIDEAGNWIVKDNILNTTDKNNDYHYVRRDHGSRFYMTSLAQGWLRSDGRSNFDKIDPRVVRVSVHDYWAWNPSTNNFLDEGVGISWGNYKAPPFDTILYTVSFDPDSPEATAKSTLEGTLATWWASMMTASSEADCLAAFDTAVAAAEGLGIGILEAFYAAQYAERAAKMG